MCNSDKNNATAWIVSGLLLLAVAGIFGQTLRYDFINYDDNAYLLENQKNVAAGLTPASVAWAFRTNHCGLWGPVTWLSHLADCSLYGFRPWGHHLTNVLLHAVATLLLFWTFRRMTGALWPSALVAALFAVHPLHVESVAWIAERKGLLGGLFFIATLAAYVHFVRRPFSWGNYLLLVLFFVLGLMSKPIGVTLPFLFLLLDYWPLGRMRLGDEETRRLGDAPISPKIPKQESPSLQVSQSPSLYSPLSHLLLEKIPLLALALVACVAAPLTQDKAVVSIEAIPLWPRIANALTAYVSYIEKFLWPENLAAIYLHPGVCPPMQKTVGAVLILLAISFMAVVWRRKCPWLFVGWFWFLGTMVPMLGLVQLGSHSMADRYTYVTQIGLYMIVAWGLAGLAARWPGCRSICAAVVAAALAAFAVAAWLQTSHWRDSKTLWTHVVTCHPENGLAHDYLGLAFLREGNVGKAMDCYADAFRLNRNDLEALSKLGGIFAAQGKYAEAEDLYRRALRLAPGHVGLMNNLALALAGAGRTGEAVEVFEDALKIEPNSPVVNGSFGSILAGRGELDRAIQCFQTALAADPANDAVRKNLHTALDAKAKSEQ